jgi:hypothetical protein
MLIVNLVLSGLLFKVYIKGFYKIVRISFIFPDFIFIFHVSCHPLRTMNRTGRVAQVVKCIPRKHKALSSNPTTGNK